MINKKKKQGYDPVTTLVLVSFTSAILMLRSIGDFYADEFVNMIKSCYRYHQKI